MGAFLIFQPGSAAGEARAPFDRVRDWMQRTRGFALQAEVGMGARVAKFRRRDGSGAGIASSPSGWLVSAGLWDHPDAPAPNDTQWLLEALQGRGESGLDDLDGFYALAWFQARDGRLSAVTDHLGRLHLYAGESKEGLWISTSATAVAGALGAGADPLGVFELLTTGTIYEERSPFSGVRRLPAARRFMFRSGRLEGTTRAPDVAPRTDRPRASAADVRDACTGTLVRLLKPFPRTRVDLTGGRDSRLVVGLMHRAGLEFEARVSGSDGDPDVLVARRLARHLGLVLHQRHASVRKDPQGSFEAVLQTAGIVDGMSDAVYHARFLGKAGGAEEGGQDLRVTGAGGEVYRGSWWKGLDLDSNRPVVERSMRRFTKSRKIVRIPFLGEALRYDPTEHFSGVIGRTVAGCESFPVTTQIDQLYLHLRVQCWQGTNASLGNLSSPRVSPLLLRAPLERVLAIDDREKKNDRVFSEIFRALGPPFSTTPLATGLPPLELDATNAWRYLACAPGWVWRRVAKAFRPRHRGRVDDESSSRMLSLFGGGAADFLAPRMMVLLPLFEKALYEKFLELGSGSGRVSPWLVGRLISVEFALREAASLHAGLP